jgi:hypothetical protein
MHAILTGLLTPVKPDRIVRPVVKYGFIASGLIYIILSILGVLAFGTGLYYENSPGDLKFYHFNFKDHYPAAFYIVSFYFFLLISIFPMITIAVRNSLIYILMPAHMPKTNFTVSKYTIIFTAALLMPCILIAAFL